jgi:hypothetical protein
VEAQLSADVASKLDALLQRVDLAHFADAYDRYDRSDATSSFITYSPAAATMKTIRHYWGDWSGDARRLGDVELEIERLIDAKRWDHPASHESYACAPPP